MALDMQERARRDWFGFSPVVVLVGAAVLLAAGGAFWKSRGSGGYVGELTQMCAVAQEEMMADFKAREAAPAPPIDFHHTLFHDFERTIGQRLVKLRALPSPSDHAAEHAALIAGEQHALDVAAGHARRVEVMHRAAVTHEAVDETIAAVAEQDARYRALGVPKGCAD